MNKENTNLDLKLFEYIRSFDKENYQNYDMDHLILLNKKFSYPMFLTSSNKEEVKFSYEMYYEIDSNKYEFIDEIDDLISEDFNYSYKDVSTIIQLKIGSEKINFEFNEMIDMIDYDILNVISDKFPLYLWNNKYFIENEKLYKEIYL